jgi:DNA-binding NarL/FixJ family response regulator
MNKITIAIADDQNIFRQMLSMSIGSVAEFEVFGTYKNGVDFMNAMAVAETTPDIAVIDIDMPQMNGIELNASLQQSYPTIKTIILSQHTEERIIATMINAGAAAYLDKGCKQEELFLAIQTVFKTGYYMNELTLRSLTRRFNQPGAGASLPEHLSTREMEILTMICQEHSNREIAENLHISTKTVDFHRANLMKKTNSKNVVGLIIYAIKNSLSVFGR